MKRAKPAILCLALTLLAAPLHAQYKTEKAERTFDIKGDEAFYLEIDIDAGEVLVQRNPRNNQIAFSIIYTVNEFDFDFDYSERNRSLAFTFDKNNWIDSDVKDGDAEIELLLPSNVVLDMQSKIKAGEIEMNVGGLSLRNFKLKTLAGEVTVDFDKPNKIVMNALDINIKVGETQLRNLGNARFRNAEIDNGIGSLDIDFSGDLPSDAFATIDLDIGETDIFLPDDYGVKLSVRKFLFLSQVNVSGHFRKSGSHFYSENYDGKRKALDLEVRPGIGELNVRYR